MRRPLLILLLLAIPAGVGAFVHFAGGGRSPGGARDLALRSADPPTPPQEAVELIPPPIVREPLAPAISTVLWPLRVELELVEARFLPKEEGVPPVGSGAGARLTGRFTGLDDRPVEAEVRFVAGANAGRVLRTDRDGRVGAADLYPGLSVVEVRGPTIFGSRREVRLRQGQESQLNIGYGRPATVVGKVQDTNGVGIEDAHVTIDGTRVNTDAEGKFFLASVAAGQVLCEVEKDGFAHYQELVWLAGGKTNADDRMTFTLKRGADLRIVLQGNAGGPGPAQLFLLSDRPQYSASSAYRNESFPWHKVNPVEAWPGTPVTISGLPPELIKIHVFRPGARAQVKTVNLATSLRDVVIPISPAPVLTGVVRESGKPVFGAKVKLEAPDRVRAALGYFTEPSYFLETAVLPTLPPSLQETTTDKEGRFVFSAWPETSPVRYLEARGPGGGSWAGRFVKPEDTDVALELEQVDLGDSVLLVEFPGRHQGLPVELWIGGSPGTPQILGTDEELEVSNLVAGRWRLNVSWHGQPVGQPEEITIEDVRRYRVDLPPECIEGQSEEQWSRAGREYPLAGSGTSLTKR